ncbi:hypothetical protein [Hallella sp.]
MKRLTILVVAFLALLTACENKASSPNTPQEDTTAKKMLQGIWVDEDAQTVAFKA